MTLRPREQSRIAAEAVAVSALAFLAGDEERYVLATRDSQQTMEKLLNADIAAIDDSSTVSAIDREDAALLRSIAALPKPEDER